MFSFTMKYRLQVILLLMISETCLFQKPNTDNRRHDVYIAGFFPFGKGVENAETGRGVMPSVKLALDHVNEHSGVLRNYRLHMWWNDTMCNAAVGVKAFFDMMHSGPHKLMLFGAACTHVTDPIAKASKHWHLTQGNGINTLDVKYGDNTTSSCQSTKILGIYVDRNLRWTSYIDVLCKKNGLLLYVKENEDKFIKLNRNHEHSTRNSDVLLIPMHNTAKFENSFYYQSIKLFNHLPSSLKVLKAHLFKNIVKSLLLTKAYYGMAEYFDDSNLSYADTHPMFTKENFPNFFRIVPSENAFNPPRLSLLRAFNWTRVGTIYQNEPRYSLAHNRLVAELDTLGYQVVETQSFTNEVTAALSKLKEKDTRVILGNFNERWAKQIFCEAYKLEMYGRKYQWIVMGTYRNGWWKTTVPDFNCTLDELEMSLQQTILTDLLPLSTSGEITVSGITADEYQSEYDSRRGKEYSRFHGYTYDGIWAVALAIQNVAHKVKYFRRNTTVIDFRYRDPLWERLFLEALRNTSFEGVTGPVRFYDNERKASILLKQFQDGKEIKVGEYSAATQHLDLTLGKPLKWIGKHPPKDRTLLIIEHTRVNKTVYAILASLAVCGIIMASVFLAFNIKYRNQRYIKMSSPQLNNLIIIGCMLTYTSIVFLGLDSGLSSIEAFPYICTARAWTLMAGFSLAFGAMFSKTWRVHSIFTDVKLNKKVIKDYQLFMVVGVLLFIDLVIMTTWQVADPFYRETKQLEPYPHPSSEDIIIIPENEYCASERMTIFVGSIYAYKGLLMIFGAFLAWETRHVSIPALNDSRHVGLSVYNVAIMCICGAAVALVLVDHQDAMFLIIGVFVMFCTTATLWLVFVPKMLELRRNPAGSIDKRCRATLRPMSKTRRDSSVSELETKMKDVKSLNSKYRKTLLEKESELQMLIRRLGNEAKEILESRTDSMSDTNRLSVPLIRKEPPSATETSDITSLCSLSSQDLTSLQHNDSQKKKKAVIQESPKNSSHTSDNNNSSKTAEPEVGKITQNGSISNQSNVNEFTKPEKQNNIENINMAITKETIAEEKEKNKENIIDNMKRIDHVSRTPTKTPLHDRKISRVGETENTSNEKRRCSMKNESIEYNEDSAICPRRVSIPNTRGTPKRKTECGTHVVAKSELWDTGNQHRCTKIHQKPLKTISQDEDDSHMHRTVSERNRHTHKREKSPKKELSNICNQQCNKLGYFQSTPNVAAIKPSTKHKRDKSMYNATSESELLDREILPIFQKLLTERNKSQHNISFGRSCPNISIKCDIVEYL